MKITLIRPSLVTKIDNKAHIPAPPLGLALIAAVLEKKQHQVHIIDGINQSLEKFTRLQHGVYVWGQTGEEILAQIPADSELIGVSCMFTVDWIFIRTLIQQIKEHFPSVPLVAGGEHITALPDLCMEECSGLDYCVSGEGEDTIQELCEAIQNKSGMEEIAGLTFRKKDGSWIKNKKRERIRDLNTIPFPAWHLFPVDFYFENNLNFGVGNSRTLPMLATRGCPYRCHFCSSPDMWGTRYFLRDVKHVVDEIAYLYNTYQVRNIDLYDLTAIVNGRWIIELCKEIKERKLKITWQLPSGTRSEAITPEVLREMYSSGCTIVSYAPESGSDRILQQVEKKVNLQRMLQSIRQTYQMNIFVKVNIILGFPGETHADVFKTIGFILKCSWYGAHDMGPNPFYPIPGTRLFQALVEEKKIDIKSNQYYLDLLDADNIFSVPFYNNKIALPILRLYYLLYLFLFYSTNYIFYPKRFLKLWYNVFHERPQTRGERLLLKMMYRLKKRFSLKKSPKG